MNDAYFNDVIIGSLIAGLMCGAIPMIIGAIKNQLGLGFLGFVACIFSAFILGLILAIPICGLSVWVIFNVSKDRPVNVQNVIYKRCPYCAENILTQAIVCKHCGRDLIK